jgi:hypothetical protein
VGWVNDLVSLGNMEVILFFAFAGGVCGWVVARMLRGRRNPIGLTVVFSALAGTCLQVVIAFCGESYTYFSDHPYSAVEAFRAGLGASIILGFSAPFTAGLPAGLVGYLCQRTFQKNGNKGPLT